MTSSFEMGRAWAVRTSAASLRLSGLKSSPAVNELLAAWTRGEIEDEDLEAAERLLLKGE